jgi:hypothetical protein
MNLGYESIFEKFLKLSVLKFFQTLKIFEKKIIDKRFADFLHIPWKFHPNRLRSTIKMYKNLPISQIYTPNIRRPYKILNFWNFLIIFKLEFLISLAKNRVMEFEAQQVQVQQVSTPDFTKKLKIPWCVWRKQGAHFRLSSVSWVMGKKLKLKNYFGLDTKFRINDHWSCSYLILSYLILFSAAIA